MQRDPRTPVEIVDDEAPGVAEVDAKLVELAKRRSRVVLTNDFNLNRVAELQGVRVMNINSLANAVKPAVLPGEELRVKVIQEGKEAGQGVGFLDDGTMIVVEGGARLIDREVDVSVTRVLQTVAGRMIFAQPRARLSGGGRGRPAPPTASAARGRRGRGRRLVAADGRRRQAHGADRRAGRSSPGRSTRSPPRPAVGRLVARDGPRARRRGGGAAVAARRAWTRSSPGGARARRRSPRASGASTRVDPGGADRPVLVHDGARPLVVARRS